MNDLIVAFSIFYIGIVGIIIFLNLQRNKMIEIFNPIIFYSILWSIPFAIIPLLIYFDILDPAYVLTKQNIKSIDIVISQLMAIISLISLTIGFAFGDKIKLMKSKALRLGNRWNNYGIFIVLLLYSLIIILNVKHGYETGTIFHGVDDLREGTEELGFWSYIYVLFGINRASFFYLCFLPLLSLMSYGYFKNKFYLFFSISNIFFLITVSCLSGQKELLFSPLFVFLYYLYYIKNLMNLKKELFLITSLVLLIILIFPIFNLFRGYLNMVHQKPDLRQVMSLYTGNFSIETIKQNLNYIFLRFDHLNTSLSIVDSDISFKFGYTYILGILSFISSFPKMPKAEFMGVGFNNIFAREYGIIDKFNYTTHITLPSFVEVYMNFGFLSIPFCMFLYGLVYRKIYYLIKSDDLNWKLLGFYLWYIIVFQGSALAFSTIMFSLGRTIIPLIFVLLILNYRWKS